MKSRSSKKGKVASSFAKKEQSNTRDEGIDKALLLLENDGVILSRPEGEGWFTKAELSERSGKALSTAGHYIATLRERGVIEVSMCGRVYFYRIKEGK